MPSFFGFHFCGFFVLDVFDHLVFWVFNTFQVLQVFLVILSFHFLSCGMDSTKAGNNIEIVYYLEITCHRRREFCGINQLAPIILNTNLRINIWTYQTSIPSRLHLRPFTVLKCEWRSDSQTQKKSFKGYIFTNISQWFDRLCRHRFNRRLRVGTFYNEPFVVTFYMGLTA